jgi:hypothetical protein
LAAIAGLVALGAGSACFAVTIDGGTSTTVDGWQITPDVGLTVQATVNNDSLSLIKTAVFTTDAPLNIQFVQAGPTDDNPFEVTSESIENSTGGDWTGITFSLTSPATFGSISEIFSPPAGVGYNYGSGTINAQATMVTYTGTQMNGATSEWGTPSMLTINAPVAPPGVANSFTLGETPTGSSPPPTGVPLPAAVWQTLTMLLGLGVVGVWRKVLKA